MTPSEPEHNHLRSQSASHLLSVPTLPERLMEDVQPHIRRRLQQKGVLGDDLDDLCAEAMGRFATALHNRQARDQAAIDNPTRYALTVVDTVFDDHLRRTRPNWCRLKRRILYLLDSNKTKGLFARWKHRSALIGGFSRWSEHPFRPNARYHAFCSRPALFCEQELRNQNPPEVPLPALMAHLFRWLGIPLEVDDLTSRLAALQNITDAQVLSLEALAQQSDSDPDHWLPPSSEDVSARVLDDMQGETFRAQLWQVLCVLPVRQRAALLLGMRQDELLLTGTLTDIATILEMPDQTLVTLWPDLPLADTRIALYLDITPKQVSNLRKCARERIGRWLTRNRQEETKQEETKEAPIPNPKFKIGNQVILNHPPSTINHQP